MFCWSVQFAYWSWTMGSHAHKHYLRGTFTIYWPNAKGELFMDFSAILKAVNNFVWGPVMLFFLVGTGVFLTIRLKFLPWINLWYAIKSIFRKSEHAGDISPFQSLMTALAATVGTGNIVGVATALVLGGPGALVWMFWPFH